MSTSSSSVSLTFSFSAGSNAGWPRYGQPAQRKASPFAQLPHADALAALCAAMRAGDAATVNAHLLFVSTHHWEEAAYWFPSLKRLVKL